MLLLTTACSGGADDGATGNEPVYNPSDLHVSAVYADAVELSWTPEAGASEYEIEYATGSATKTIRSAVSECLIEGLPADTDMKFRIRTIRNGAEGPWSGLISGSTAAFAVSVTSFNVLGVESKADWSPREAAVGAIIRRADHNPDIICLQECKNEPMFTSVQRMLSGDYSFHTLQKTQPDADPTLIGWKQDRFELVSGGSIDMLLGNVSYAAGDYANGRYAHYVQLRERKSGRELLVYNIHVKAGGTEFQQVRYDCVSTLCPVAISRAEKAGVPVLVMGDFNNYMTTWAGDIPPAPYVCVQNGFTEVSTIARECLNLNYKTSGVDLSGAATPRSDGNSRIDYIFAWSTHPFGVSKYQTVIDFVEGSTTKLKTPVPSDHHPVNATIHLAYR